MPQSLGEDHWEYTHDRRYIKLYRGREPIGTLTIKRDLEGRVQSGKVLSIDPTKINCEEFFSKLRTAPGIDQQDVMSIEMLQQGFLLVSSPMQNQGRTLFFYIADPQRREHMLQAMREHRGDRIAGYCRALRETS